ncbi:hypothetical protein ACMBCM_05520, partial [Spiroplasma sp. K1]
YFCTGSIHLIYIIYYHIWPKILWIWWLILFYGYDNLYYYYYYYYYYYFCVLFYVLLFVNKNV